MRPPDINDGADEEERERRDAFTSAHGPICRHCASWWATHVSICWQWDSNPGGWGPDLRRDWLRFLAVCQDGEHVVNLESA